MLLIEKRVELGDKYYIDSWYDRYSKSYITQVKDLEDNEIDYAYSGNSRDRDADIKYFKKQYERGILEDLVQERKKKKQSLPNTGLSPILPDSAKGVDKFNSAASTEGQLGQTVGSAGE